MQMSELLTDEDFATARAFAVQTFRKYEHDKDVVQDLAQEFLIRVAGWDCSATNRDAALALLRTQYRKLIHHTFTSHLRRAQRFNNVLLETDITSEPEDLTFDDGRDSMLESLVSPTANTEPEYGVVFMAICEWLKSLHPGEQKVWQQLLLSGGDRSMTRDVLGCTRQYVGRIVNAHREEFEALCAA